MSLTAPFRILFNRSLDRSPALSLDRSPGVHAQDRELNQCLAEAKESGSAAAKGVMLEKSLGPDVAARCTVYHAGIPHNRQTPLFELPELASRLGLGAIHVKDESWRMGLNAFKALGSTWAVACVLAERFGIDPDTEMPGFPELMRLARKELAGKTTFVTASDGNHGRGLAFAARLFGQKARVLLPAGTAQARFDNILCEGGEPVLTSLTYDECVEAAAAETQGADNCVLVQDTGFADYEDIPLRVMQGYLSMAHEVFEQLGQARPTHVFLQAGVGSFAAALAACLTRTWDVAPVIVEPQSADCLYRTMQAGDGKLHAVDGPMDSIMAGLCCGCPSTLAMDILASRARGFIACEDDAAELGMRLYASPLGRDPRIVSGESGACTLGALAAILLEHAEAREELGLDRDSRVLLINTEGDTDPVNYHNVLAKGPVAISGRS